MKKPKTRFDVICPYSHNDITLPEGKETMMRAQLAEEIAETLSTPLYLSAAGVPKKSLTGQPLGVSLLNFLSTRNSACYSKFVGTDGTYGSYEETQALIKEIRNLYEPGITIHVHVVSSAYHIPRLQVLWLFLGWNLPSGIVIHFHEAHVPFSDSATREIYKFFGTFIQIFFPRIIDRLNAALGLSQRKPGEHVNQ